MVCDPAPVVDLDRIVPVAEGPAEGVLAGAVLPTDFSGFDNSRSPYSCPSFEIGRRWSRRILSVAAPVGEVLFVVACLGACLTCPRTSSAFCHPVASFGARVGHQMRTRSWSGIALAEGRRQRCWRRRHLAEGLPVGRIGVDRTGNQPLCSPVPVQVSAGSTCRINCLSVEEAAKEAAYGEERHVHSGQFVPLRRQMAACVRRRG